MNPARKDDLGLSSKEFCHLWLGTGGGIFKEKEKENP